MEITGKLVKKLQAEAGTSKAGKAWEKQTIVIDTGNDFNNLIAVSAFGEDKIKHLNKLEVGMDVAIMCNVYSREYNGKYYTSLDGYWFANKNAEVNKNIQEDENDLPF